VSNDKTKKVVVSRKQKLEVSQRVDKGGIMQWQKYTGLLLAVLLLVTGRGKQAKLKSGLPKAVSNKCLKQRIKNL
jgi:hypothetical protein